MVMWEEKPLQQIVDELWPMTFGNKPNVTDPASNLAVLLQIIDEVVKQRIREACEEPVDYDKLSSL